MKDKLNNAFLQIYKGKHLFEETIQAQLSWIPCIFS